MTDSDFLIRNARLRDDQPLVDIAIKDGKIVALQENIEAVASETIDAAGRAVIPGLIESHLHLDKALLHLLRLPAPLGTLDEAIRVTQHSLRRGRNVPTSWNVPAGCLIWPCGMERFTSELIPTSISSRD